MAKNRVKRHLDDLFPHIGDVPAFVQIETHECTAPQVSVAGRSPQFPKRLAQVLVAWGARANVTMRLRAVEVALARLQDQLAMLQRMSTVTVPLQTFAPEPYELLRPIEVVVQREEGDVFIARFCDANLSTSGSTVEEAYENLKSLILDAFDSLSEHSEGQLGPGPKRSLQVLKEFVKRTGK